MYTIEDYRQIFTDWPVEIWATAEPRRVSIDKRSSQSFKSLKNQIDKLAKSLGFVRVWEDENTLTYAKFSTNSLSMDNKSSQGSRIDNHIDSGNPQINLSSSGPNSDQMGSSGEGNPLRPAPGITLGDRGSATKLNSDDQMPCQSSGY